MKKLVGSKAFQVVIAVMMITSLTFSFIPTAYAQEGTGGDNNGNVQEIDTATFQAGPGLLKMARLTEGTPIDPPEDAKSAFLKAVLEESYSKTGEAMEKDFMTFMIKHHMVAVVMANYCIDRAVHQELVDLCKAIQKAQATQVAEQNFYLAMWFDLYTAPTLLEQDEWMAGQLADIQKGDDFDKRFLELMVPHHAQAVVTGKVCAQNASHDLLKTLCGAIVYFQTTQIQLQVNWLKEWYGEELPTDPMQLAKMVEDETGPFNGENGQ